MATDFPITFASWGYDRIRPLLDGIVRPDGIDLRVLVVEPPHHFYRMLHHGEFEASEMSLSWYTRTLFHEPRPFEAIPAFPSRMFRHSAIYVNDDANIRSPSDLRGKRVGCPEYQMTLAVWVKGILQDLYDVPIDSVTYHTGGLEEPGRREVPMDLPDGIVVEPIGDDRALSQLLEAGEIDALYGPEPSSFRRSSKVRRLFEDYPSIERRYLQETGIFPIMHTVVIRQDVLAAHPWVARELLTALESAKQIAYEDLFELGAVMHMLPWLPAHAEETREMFGTDDWWPYGVEPNREALDTFLRYSYEQGLCPRRVEVDELFFPATYGTARK
jgi:4,5-dihydroxyphthalate decarboxylase